MEQHFNSKPSNLLSCKQRLRYPFPYCHLDLHDLHDMFLTSGTPLTFWASPPHTQGTFNTHVWYCMCRTGVLEEKLNSKLCRTRKKEMKSSQVP